MIYAKVWKPSAVTLSPRDKDNGIGRVPAQWRLHFRRTLAVERQLIAESPFQR